MNSRTILSAFLTRRDDLEDRYIIHGPKRARMEIQLSKFYMELLRRMDQRDDLVHTFDELQREIGQIDNRTIRLLDDEPIVKVNP